jgi:hypothetical protein
MVAQVPPFIVDVGQIAAAVTAVLALIAMLSRSRVGRWLASKASGDLADWVEAKVRTAIVEEVGPVRADMAQVGGRLDQLDQRVEEMIVKNDRDHEWSRTSITAIAEWTDQFEQFEKMQLPPHPEENP